MSECTPTEADREDAKLFLIGLSLDGTDETPQSLPAEGVDDIVAELAALFAKVRADERAKRPDRIEELEKNLSYEVEQKIKLADTLRDERAKRPDREQIERTVRAHRVWWNFETGSLCQCGWKCLLSEHPAHVADAVLSSLALKTETDQELQDRIEVLEKNLAYEVAQKIKLAEQLQAATATDLTLEQARWKMHAGIESRCSEEVAAEVKPVIDLVFSSLALEPEAREEPTGRNWVPKEELDFYVEPLTTEAREERRPSRVLNEYDDSTTRGLRRGEEVLRQLEHHWAADSATQAIEELLRLRRIVEAREEAELFHDQDGDLWKLTDKGEWFHEEEPGEFRQVLSIDAADQTLTPVGHAELAPDAEAAREVE